jgi:hypothetical protein
MNFNNSRQTALTEQTVLTLTKTKLRGFSLQANYTNQATAACRWS